MVRTIAMCCSLSICFLLSSTCLAATSHSNKIVPLRTEHVRLFRETPDFISPQLWPPNSPDLNLVDYQIWSVLEERVYRSRIRDIDHLRARLVEEWQLLDHVIIDRAIKQRRPPLPSSTCSFTTHT